jgi:hypothetical protein
VTNPNSDYTFHKIEMIVAIPHYFTESHSYYKDCSLWVTVNEDALILGMTDSELALAPIPPTE